MLICTIQKQTIVDNIRFTLDSNTRFKIETESMLDSSNFVRGWCFIEGSEINLSYQVDNGHLVECNTERPDVLAAFIGTCKVTRSGFIIPVDSQIENLNFYHQGKKVAVLKLEFQKVTVDDQAFFEKTCDSIVSRLKGNEANLSSESLNKFLALKDLLLESYSGKVFFHKESKVDPHLISKFIAEDSLEGFKTFFKEASYDKLTMDSPLDEQKAYCSSSYYIAPFNYLKFVKNNGEVFFVIQHFSIADIVFYPENLVMIFKSFGIDSERYFHIILETLLKISNYFVDGPFNGVYLMHDRPYHFSYDVAPTIQILKNNNLLSKIPRFVYHKNKSFYTLSEVLKCTNEELVCSEAEFIKHLTTPGFTSLSGVQFGHSPGNNEKHLVLLEEFDSGVMKYVLEEYEDNYVDIITSNFQGFVIWAGITSQKRALLNQVEEIANAVNALAVLFGKVTLLVDGWTSPIEGSERDKIESNNDEMVYKNIMARLNPEVSSHSIIGLNTFQKLKLANSVHYFIANHATGSMLIGRFARKKGITHIANNWNGIDLVHIHHNSIRLSHANVVNKNEDPSNIADVSYSAKKGIIGLELLSLLKNDLGSV